MPRITLPFDNANQSHLSASMRPRLNAADYQMDCSRSIDNTDGCFNEAAAECRGLLSDERAEPHQSTSTLQ